jgi:hypothetical protein
MNQRSSVLGSFAISVQALALELFLYLETVQKTESHQSHWGVFKFPLSWSASLPSFSFKNLQECLLQPTDH